jgi:hypothetical protein
LRKVRRHQKCIREPEPNVQNNYTIAVSIIRDGVLNGTPKHKDSKESRCHYYTGEQVKEMSCISDKECNRLLRRRKAALFKLKEFPTRENFLSYKKKESLAKSGLIKLLKGFPFNLSN